MLSRVANSIYWMCRYIERAENIARFVDVSHHLSLDLPPGEADPWEPLVRITGDIDIFNERYPEATSEHVIQFLTFDTQYAHSLLSCITVARENARSVRDVISSEMWEQVNALYLMVQEAGRADREVEDPHGLFQDIKRASHLFTGLTEDTMAHGEGWHFANMGRLLERADKTTRILDVKYFLLLPQPDYVGTPFDNIQWAAVLKSASALEMYRKRFHRLAPHLVADFLLLDREFPRAVHSALIAAEDSLHAITGSPAGTFHNLAERRLGKLRAELDYTDINEVMQGGLHEYLDGTQARLNDVGAAIAETFFSLKPAPTGAL